MRNDVYGEPEIIRGKNIVAKVYSPIITEEEKERRMAQIKKASISLVLAKERNKENL